MDLGVQITSLLDVRRISSDYSKLLTKNSNCGAFTLQKVFPLQTPSNLGPLHTFAVQKLGARKGEQEGEERRGWRQRKKLISVSDDEDGGQR